MKYHEMMLKFDQRMRSYVKWYAEIEVLLVGMKALCLPTNDYAELRDTVMQLSKKQGRETYRSFSRCAIENVSAVNESLSSGVSPREIIEKLKKEIGTCDKTKHTRGAKEND